MLVDGLVAGVRNDDVHDRPFVYITGKHSIYTLCTVMQEANRDCPRVHSSQSVTSGTDLDGYLLQIEILLAGPTWLSQSVTTGEDFGC